MLTHFGCFLAEMKFTDWKQIAEFVGIVAIIASLIFVGLEVQQSGQIGQGEIGLSTLQSLGQTKELLVTNPDVWTRGCRGDELSDTDRATFALMFRHYASEKLLLFLATDSVLDVDSSYLVNSWAANYHRYPGFAAMADAQQDWLEQVDLDPPERQQL